MLRQKVDVLVCDVSLRLKCLLNQSRTCLLALGICFGHAALLLKIARQRRSRRVRILHPVFSKELIDAGWHVQFNLMLILGMVEFDAKTNRSWLIT